MNASPLKVAVILTSASILRVPEATRCISWLRQELPSETDRIILCVVKGTAAEALCLAMRNPVWDELRSITWRDIGSVEYKSVYRKDVPYGKYVYPVDGGLGLRDTDAWLIVGGIPKNVIAPLVPFAIYAADHMVPPRRGPVHELVAVIENIRNANAFWMADDSRRADWQALSLAKDTLFASGALDDDSREIKQPVVEPENLSDDELIDDDTRGDGSKRTASRPPLKIGYFPTEGQISLVHILPPELHLTADILYTGAYAQPKRRRSSDTDIAPGQPFWENLSTSSYASLERIETEIARMDAIVIGPLTDRNDYRLRLAHKNRIPIVMLWHQSWPVPHSMNVTHFFTDYVDVLALSEITTRLAERGTVPPLNEQEGRDTALPATPGQGVLSTLFEGRP